MREVLPGALTLFEGMDPATRDALILLSLALVVLLYVWVSLGLAATFRKMGEDPYKGWVPFLCLGTLLRWGGYNPWLAALAIVPGVNIVFAVFFLIAIHRINPGFGFGGAMTVTAALVFPVWATIAGFGPARWLGARRPAHLPPPSSRLVTPDDPEPFSRPALPVPPSSVGPAEDPPYPQESDMSASPDSSHEPQRRSNVPPVPPLPPVDDAEALFVSLLSTPDAQWAPPAPQPASAASERNDEADPGVGVAASAPEAADRSDDGASAPAAESSDVISAVPGPAVTRQDPFPELTDEVSAVAGTPVAGRPQPASGSVIAQQGYDDLDVTLTPDPDPSPEPDAEPVAADPEAAVEPIAAEPVADTIRRPAPASELPGDLDQTVIARRRRPRVRPDPRRGGADRHHGRHRDPRPTAAGRSGVSGRPARGAQRPHAHRLQDPRAPGA